MNEGEGTKGDVEGDCRREIAIAEKAWELDRSSWCGWIQLPGGVPFAVWDAPEMRSAAIKLLGQDDPPRNLILEKAIRYIEAIEAKRERRRRAWRWTGQWWKCKP